MKRLLLVSLLTTGLGLSLAPTAFAAPTITQQPANQTVQAGGTASFSANATGYTFVDWRVSTDGGSTWSAVSDNSTYSGSRTTTLTIHNVPAAFNGNMYIAAFIDITISSAFTNPALLRVTNPPPPSPTPAPTTPPPAPASPSQNVNTASFVVNQFLLSAYAAYQAGTGSLLTLEAAYLAYLNIQDALHFDALGNLAARESSAYQAAVFAYYGKSYSLIDVNTSGSADSMKANQFANYTLYFSYQVFLGN